MKNYVFLFSVAIFTFVTLIGASWYFLHTHTLAYENYKFVDDKIHFLENIQKKLYLAINHVKDYYEGFAKKNNIAQKVQDLNELRSEFKSNYTLEFNEISKDFDAFIDDLEKAKNQQYLTIENIKEMELFFSKFNSKLNNIYQNSHAQAELESEKFTTSIKMQFYLALGIITFIFAIIFISIFISKSSYKAKIKKLNEQIKEIYLLLQIQNAPNITARLDKSLQDLGDEIQKQAQNRKNILDYMHNVFTQAQSGKIKKLEMDFEYDPVFNKALESLMDAIDSVCNLASDDLEDLVGVLEALINDNYFIKTKKCNSKAEKAIEEIRNKLISLNIKNNEEKTNNQINQNINYDIN